MNTMKSLLALAAGLCLVTACSAAQKSAEISLGLENTVCVVSKINEPFPQALEECGLANLTNPQQLQQLQQLFDSAKAGAKKAGACRPAGPDGGQ